MAITGNDFMHPADLEALDNLRAIPIFGAFTKAFLKAVPERFMLSLDLANKIRIGPNQLPNLYRHLPPICEALGVEQPEFFLEMNPAPNAYTSGDSRAFLTVTSGLVEAMQEDELRAVIAHECGHIACHHVLYHTMADMLVKFGAGLFTLVDMVAQPLQLALLHWSRCSEFSADRAAAVILGPDTVITTMVRLAGGPAAITNAVNVDEYLKQAEDYEAMASGSNWDWLLQRMALSQQDHPFLATRAREVRRWSKTDEFGAITRIRNAAPGTICANCRSAIEPGWKFCRTCGSPVADQAPRLAS